MGKKNNGSIGQQNKQLMKEICSEWNSKYRQEDRCGESAEASEYHGEDRK